MKKYLVLFVSVLSTAFFVGCSDDDFTPADYVSFADVPTISVNEGESKTVEVKVYTSIETGSARTFNVNVREESTLSPSAYTVSENVTIPANSNVGTVTVDISGAGIANAGDVLILELEATNGTITGEPKSLSLFKVCPFDASQWFGTYDIFEGFVAGANEGLNLAGVVGESFQIELLENPADPSGSVILGNSEGFGQFFASGATLTFGACAGNVQISNLNLAGFDTLAVTSSSFDEETGTITVDGDLGAYGPYRIVLTPQ